MSEQINPGPGWRLATTEDVGATEYQLADRTGDWVNPQRGPLQGKPGKWHSDEGVPWKYARVRDTATIALKPGTWYRTAAGNKWFFVGLNQDGDYVMSVGETAWTIGKDIDLTGWSEWREPRTWEVEVWVYVKPDGSRTFSLVELKGNVLAKKRIVETLVEGEGL